MMGLNQLMKREGVVAAGQFSDDGRVLSAVGELSRKEMQEVARACARHQRGAMDTAVELDLATPLNWHHLNGWVLWAGDLALVVSGETGVFVEATKADFNQLLLDLFGPDARPKAEPTPGAASEGSVEPMSPASHQPRRANMSDEIRKDPERELSTTETHKPARPMQFFKDQNGNGWLCDKDIDPNRDLEAQGCWRCDEMAFPMGN